MDLIIGGVYQGKLDYAKRRFGVTDDEVFDCAKNEGLDTEKRCIYGLECYLKTCLLTGKTPDLDDFRPDAAVICTDIFCGLVPADDAERAWRELAGKSVTRLAARAETVTRIFCGLPQRLK